MSDEFNLDLQFSEFKSKGDEAFSQDDLFQAISYYTDALSLVPDDEEVLGCRSAVYSKLNMYNEAKNDAERLISAVPYEPKGYFLKAVALESLGNNTDALTSFLSAYERDLRHPLELVLSIIQVAGTICQLSEDEEISLTQDGDNDDAKKFKILVLLGKAFHKHGGHTLAIEILVTALTSHCNLNKSSTYLQDPETGVDKHDSQLSLASISDHLLAPRKKHCLSSLYITTGCHGDPSETTLDQDKIEKSPTIDSQTIMSALATLSQSYFALGKLKQALVYSKQCLMMGLEYENKKYELRCYVQLSNIHQRLGDYLQAISYNGKLLAVGRDLEKDDASEHEGYWNKDIERKAVWNLSAAYKSLGDLKTALRYAHEYLELVKVIDQENLTVAYSNLGQLELLLGSHQSALEFHKMEVRISKKFDDKESTAYAYGNVGKVYAAMKNFNQSEIHHMQHMKLAQSISDRVCELVAMKQLGDMFMLKGEYGKALEQYDKHLSQVKVNKLEESLQCQVYGLIGLCYWKLNQLYRAQYNYEQCLKLASQIADKQEELNARHSLAKIMKALRLYEKCRMYYNEVIPVLEHRLFMKQENQVMYDDELVDTLADCYGDLQEVLIEMECVQEALEICEHWKSKLLVNILRGRDISRTDGGILHADLSPYNAAEIFKLVDSSESLVLVYSCVKSGFMGWLLASGKGVLKFYRYKNCEHVSIEERIKDCIEKLHDNNQKNYKCDQRALPDRSSDRVSSRDHRGTRQKGSCFACSFTSSDFTPLQMLYKMLIEPFQEELQRGDEDVLSKKLVIVPDQPMNMISFPSLQDTRGKYLYETYCVSIMPCIRALSLQNSAPKRATTEEGFKILVAGNPKIPSVDLNGVPWQPPGEGVLAEREVTSIATLLGVEPVTGCQATKEFILETLSKSSLAHLVTRGSWKKSCLAFTPNRHYHCDRPHEDSYLFSVSDLLSVDMTAKLIVISSCCTGSHNFCYLKQVNLSLATAFLAAGARAVIIPLWSVEQSTLMKLYYHLYCELEKGQTISTGLTQAYDHIRSTDQLSNPVFWSSHVLLGFDGSFKLLKLRHQLYDQLLDREVSCVGCHRFGTRTSEPLDEKAKAVKFREILTSLMLQHGSLPLVLPALRDLVKLANSMLASYEEGRSLNQIVMSSQLSSSILDAPFSQDLLLYLGFNFQKDGAKDKDPFVVFPHWDYESTLKTSAVILDAACSIFEVSGLAGHLMGRLMKMLTHNNMDKMKDLLSITTKYPARIVKTSDLMVRSLWCHKEIQRFLMSVGFYEVGQSLLFNKNKDNQTMIKGALKIVSGLLGNMEMVKIKPHLSTTRELTSEDSRNIKLVSLSPIVTATNQIVMRTPWMSQRADLDEAKIKFKFAKELEAINKHFGRIATRSNYWHAQLLRAQNSKKHSLPVIGTKKQPQQLPLATNETKRRLKVKVISGLTPSCDRKLAEEEPKMTITEARERRKAIYKIYGQRYDDIAMRKRNEIRHLFSSFTGD